MVCRRAAPAVSSRLLAGPSLEAAACDGLSAEAGRGGRAGPCSSWGLEGGFCVAVADHPPPHFGRHSEPPSSFQAGPEGICSGNSGVSARLGPPSASCSESLLCKHRQGAFLPGRERFELTVPPPPARAVSADLCCGCGRVRLHARSPEGLAFPGCRCLCSRGLSLDLKAGGTSHLCVPTQHAGLPHPSWGALAHHCPGRGSGKYFLGPARHLRHPTCGFSCAGRKPAAPHTARGPGTAAHATLG